MALAYRTKQQSGNQGGAGTVPNWDIIIPSAAQVGDLGLVSVNAINSGVNHTPPTGWSQLQSGSATAGFSNVSRLYYKYLEATDINVTLKFGDSTDKWCVQARVYADAYYVTSNIITASSTSTALQRASATPTRDYGYNVQFVTGTGNVAWGTTTASGSGQQFQTNNLYAIPAYCGSASEHTVYTSAAATPTTPGIAQTPSNPLGYVGYTVLIQDRRVAVTY